MFVPPYNAILRALGTTPKAVVNQTEIAVPLRLLKFLLQIVIGKGYFNERGYLGANPDVAQALREGKIKSAFDHYVSYGYFECRRGATPDVDEDWYKRLNPDVATAIRSKIVSSAAEHFLQAGVEEFRAPNEIYQDEFAKWRGIFSKLSVSQR